MYNSNKPTAEQTFVIDAINHLYSKRRPCREEANLMGQLATIAGKADCYEDWSDKKFVRARKALQSYGYVHTTWDKKSPTFIYTEGKKGSPIAKSPTFVVTVTKTKRSPWKLDVSDKAFYQPTPRSKKREVIMIGVLPDGWSPQRAALFMFLDTKDYMIVDFYFGKGTIIAK